jgi:membrane-bound lytic murein transglycosylase F
MSNPDYFNDPVVKNGYFRGGETYNYVNYIRKDWEKYKKM